MIFAEGAFNELAVADTSMCGQAVSAARMFGEGSTLADGVAAAGEAACDVAWLTGNLFVQLIVLAIFVTYSLVLYGYGSHVATVLNLSRGKLYVEKLLEDQNYVFEKFLALTNILGLMVISVAVVKAADIGWGEQAAGLMPRWMQMSLIGLVWVAMCVVTLVQRMLLGVVGVVTLNRGLTEKITYLKKLALSLFTIIATPTVLMMALAPAGVSKVLLVIAIAESGVALVFFLFRTYMIFIEQKISILYWFLYLCAVEILPLSVPIALMLRNI